MKRVSSLLICIVLLLSLATTACAAETDYTDVRGSEWYADAVMALREKGIMEGVGNNRFDPDSIFTRAQLATVLYRLADKPTVSGEDGFTDTESGQWYSDAVLWASQNGIVNGYGNGLFGTTDPTTQEQLAVMLWRNAGAYVLGSEYADATGVENSASSWAVDAVRWTRVDGLLTDAIPFAPTEAATRAQVADMVYRYLQLMERFSEVDAVSGATQKAGEGSKALVAYFSCTGNTERIAGYVADALDADLYRIVPETPYTSADLNYNDSSTRATKEQNDPDARPAISGSVENIDDYDIVFLGYPIWWGQAPKIMYTFVDSYDLTGKTVVPFCTSGSSGIGSSAVNLSRSASGATWLEGRRFAGSTTGSIVAEWVRGLDLQIQNGGDDASVTETALILKINATEVSVEWEDNASVDALKKLVASGPLTIQMSMYGGFEQVGSIGSSLPRSDVQTTTSPGDIVLYSGNQIVVFYGSNSWAYTRLGRISDKTTDELRKLLGNGNVEITISVG